LEPLAVPDNDSMTVLVVLDLLEDFFNEGLWPESAIPGARARLVERTNDLTKICRAAGIPVIGIRFSVCWG